MNAAVINELEELRKFESCSENYFQNWKRSKHSHLELGLDLLERYEHLRASFAQEA